MRGGLCLPFGAGQDDLQQLRRRFPISHLPTRGPRQQPWYPNHPPPRQRIDAPGSSSTAYSLRQQPPSPPIESLTDVQAKMDSDLDAPNLRGRNGSSTDHHQSFVNHEHDPSDHHAFAAVNPDEFYKNYSGLQLDYGPEELPMASTSAVPRPSLRSNGDGTTPRHPLVSSIRSLPRPGNLRSVSSPIDSKAAPGNRPTGKPSVKDLRKHFDQNGIVSSIPRVQARPGGNLTSHSKAHNGAPSYAALRSAGTHDLPAENRSAGNSSRASRPKYVPEDHVSNNAQSFASRVGKPRTAVGANSNTSATINSTVPQASLSPPAPGPLPSDISSSGLLFGEILPDEWDSSALGFGIESIRLNVPDQSDSGSRQRSLSDADLEPVSPSLWYTRTDTQELESRPRETSNRGHTRTQSDVASQKTPQFTSRKPATRKSAASPKPPSASKLPLSIRHTGSSTGSSSPISRATSPSALKRPITVGQLSRSSTPTTRSKTPISRAKTPTQTAAGRKAVASGLPTPNSNARLQAFIASPLPKLSPPLRSSRPRQPVSEATTASSRMRAIDRVKAANGTGIPASSRPNEAPRQRRKISIGPIDFEQRREHIRLAYSKSVKETEAKEARQRVLERRQRGMESAARANAIIYAGDNLTADEAPLTQVKTRNSSTDEEVQKRDDQESASPASSPDAYAEVESDDHTVAIPSTGNIAPNPDVTFDHKVVGSGAPKLEIRLEETDSPTLGVPGSFPAPTPPVGFGEPQSAISTTSGITEFDFEPQEDSPLAVDTFINVPIVIETSTPVAVAPTSSSEYQYPFDLVPESPEQPSAALGAIHNTLDVLPTNMMAHSVVENEQPSGTFDIANEYYDQGTTVTILPPQDSRSHGVAIPPENVPFPRIEMQDDSDCQSEIEDLPDHSSELQYDHEDANADGCTEGSDNHAETEDCQSESRFDEQSSYRASSCASSEAKDQHEPQFTNHHMSETIPNGLLVPPVKSDRTSHQSAWTDLSVESGGYPSSMRTPDLQDEDDSPSFGHVTIYESRVISKSTELLNESHNDISEVRPSYGSGKSTSHVLPKHPSMESGTDFEIPYLAPDASSSLPYIPPPVHEAPPVPSVDSASARNSRRTSSAFYDRSRPGSAFISSERASGEFASQIDTPQTMSTGTSDLYFGMPSQAGSDIKAFAQDGQELDGKERKRLIQRRNVIKELVDTESVFVRDMNIVEEIYKGTAEACPRLDPKTVKLVFRNTDEIINFHTFFLSQIKDAVADVYAPQAGRTTRDDITGIEPSQTGQIEISDAKDREVSLGPVFMANIERMKVVHEGFLRSSDQAAKGLIQIQQDPTVQVWLNECNAVAKDLTAAWDLDSLLIKPMQRITKYPNLLMTMLQHMSPDHPDREELSSAKDTLENAIIEINKTKKNFELVGQIVGRKRKDSDVKAGFARAFGKRVDKLQTTNRPPEDPLYAKLNEKFGDDYLRLQVVLRDVEFYTRQVATYVREFLQYLSSVELIMRLQPGSYPELESKWVQFNISIRDLEKIALEDHLAQVRKQVIEPFELVIKAYGNPSLAMKKRQKRRLDFERLEQLKRSGRAGDPKLLENVEQYEALNDTLTKELPMLSALTEKVGNICLGNFVNIQTAWYSIWKDKMKTVLVDCPDTPDLQDIVSTFERDFPHPQEQLASIGILNPVPRPSQSSTLASTDDASIRRSRPSDVDTARSRALSGHGEGASYLPTQDFAHRHSGVSMSPTPSKGAPSPHQYYYRDWYANMNTTATTPVPLATQDNAGSSRSLAGTGATSTRPSTGRSFDSGGFPRQSSDYSTAQHRRDSNTTFSSAQATQENRRFSGLFHSALPLPDGPDESRRSSRASSRERAPTHDGYNILWLAASLFEFNIATTKHEAGYPYLIYQAGEIFDVIAEKGELWLAKNQDDPTQQVGWIWSKHFAKLADS